MEDEVMAILENKYAFRGMYLLAGPVLEITKKKIFTRRQKWIEKKTELTLQLVTLSANVIVQREGLCPTVWKPWAKEDNSTFSKLKK